MTEKNHKVWRNKKFPFQFSSVSKTAENPRPIISASQKGKEKWFSTFFQRFYQGNLVFLVDFDGKNWLTPIYLHAPTHKPPQKALYHILVRVNWCFSKQTWQKKEVLLDSERKRERFESYLIIARKDKMKLWSVFYESLHLQMEKNWKFLWNFSLFSEWMAHWIIRFLHMPDFFPHAWASSWMASWGHFAFFDTKLPLNLTLTLLSVKEKQCGFIPSKKFFWPFKTQYYWKYYCAHFNAQTYAFSL